MSIERFFVHEVTIRRWPTHEDRYHNIVRDLAVDPDETVVRGWVGPSQTAEVLRGGRSEERIVRPLRLPVDTDLLATDQVVVDAEPYEIDGVPDVVPTPEGPHHVHARLLAVQG